MISVRHANFHVGHSSNILEQRFKFIVIRVSDNGLLLYASSNHGLIVSYVLHFSSPCICTYSGLYVCLLSH